MFFSCSGIEWFSHTKNMTEFVVGIPVLSQQSQHFRLYLPRQTGAAGGLADFSEFGHVPGTNQRLAVHFFLVFSSLKWRWYHQKKARGVAFLNGHVTIHTKYQLALQDVSFVLGQWHYPSVPFFERHKVSWFFVLDEFVMPVTIYKLQLQ